MDARNPAAPTGRIGPVELARRSMGGMEFLDPAVALPGSKVAMLANCALLGIIGADEIDPSLFPAVFLVDAGSLLSFTSGRPDPA
jgi:hypothetical protein